MPLLIYGFLIWDRDWHIKLNTVFSELEMVGKLDAQKFDEWLGLHQIQLEQMQLLLKDTPAPSSYLASKLDQLQQIGDISSLFVFDKNFRCTSSSAGEMVGKSDFFPDMLKKAYENKTLTYLAQNPLNGRDELFLMHRIGDELWGLSVDKALWSSSFEYADSKFQITFVDKLKGPNTNIQIFTLEELQNLEKSEGIFQIHRLKGHDLGLQLPLKEALFDLEVVMPSKQIMKLEGTQVFSHLLHIVLIFIFIGGLVAVWLVRKISHPLEYLYEVMGAIEHKDYSKRYQRQPYGFEINFLGQSFNQMLDAVLQHMEEAKNERVTREILSKELNIGHEIQSELFPREIPAFPGLMMGVGFIPAKEVGGDFYDLFAKDKNRLLLSIADGSDKGISACLYSLMVRSLLRSSVLAKEDLSSMVKATNDLFCHDTGDTGNFVTLWVGLYHVKERSLSYTSAGHLPAILLHSDGTIEELSTQGMALGASVDIEIEVKTKILPANSLLLLYTDGVIEAHNEKGELYGKARLFDFLQGRCSLSPQELIDQLTLEIGEFSKHAPQHDDFTVLGVKTL